MADRPPPRRSFVLTSGPITTTTTTITTTTTTTGCCCLLASIISCWARRSQEMRASATSQSDLAISAGSIENRSRSARKQERGGRLSGRSEPTVGRKRVKTLDRCLLPALVGSRSWLESHYRRSVCFSPLSVLTLTLTLSKTTPSSHSRYPTADRVRVISSPSP